MVTYIVTLGRPGGGAGVFQIPVTALSPDMARHIATSQYPGFAALAVKAAH